MADAQPVHDGEPLKLLTDLVAEEMGMKSGQVVINNQEYEMPKDQRLYISLGLLGTKTIGTQTTYTPDPITTELVEVQTINQQQIISVTAYSSSNLARVRQWEIPLIFVSTRAQQIQETRSFTMGRVPLTMNDTSEQDGAKRINRFSFTFSLLCAYQKRKPVQYFSKFKIPPKITSNP